MGLSEDPKLQPLLFGLFLGMYLVTVLGNLLIILTVSSDSHLHTPMYFFLSNLSLSDICSISTTVPKKFMNIQTHSSIISYPFGIPVAYFDDFTNYHFKDVEISSFFCDPSQLLNLSCTDILSNNIVQYILGAFYGLFPFSGILSSYYKIVSSILRIPSSGGKYKAFSTCGSHMAVVCLFLGTGFGVYLESTVSHSPRKGAVTSVMYTVVSPMLNPFIYSLRNRDIKGALWRLHSRNA
ncbi:Olfactory receptor 7E24 [Sciurus carolinensis]|uniref:Olfactory receptor 7E24 n=1 Tax=Sciurus carolinensis TaxID=30640 RepID=A0AA41SXP3_SCICA|nr:Olfactory receptor 7E24 [Sciurus carolinensis]